MVSDRSCVPVVGADWSALCCAARHIRVDVSVGGLQSSLSTVPIPPSVTSVESAASRWVQSRSNPNTSSSAANVDLALALLRHSHRVESSAASAQRSVSVVVDPLAIGRQLREDEKARRRFLESVTETAERKTLERLISEVNPVALQKGQTLPSLQHLLTSRIAASH